jgi:Mg2+/Co2+ transporter CorB
MEESYRVWLLSRDGVRTVDGLWIYTSEQLPNEGETITVVDTSDFRRGAVRARVSEVSSERDFAIAATKLAEP